MSRRSPTSNTHLGIAPTGDDEVNELKQKTPVTSLVDEIAKKLGEMNEPG
jgi:hypothetical protein